MKNSLLLIASLVLSSVTFGQGPSNTYNNKLTTPGKVSSNKIVSAMELGNNGFEFSKNTPGKKINTKYSEFVSGIYKDKVIITSSKKIGGLAKIDKNTNEAYQMLYTTDTNKEGTLKQPLLFSKITSNKGTNEGQVAFSKDGQTLYYTRSTKKDPNVYKLYRASLQPKFLKKAKNIVSQGNWSKDTVSAINKKRYSIENPFVSPDGKQLYFASDMPGTLGGLDIFVAPIKKDGSLGTPVNLGAEINTTLNDSYPSISRDGETLFFSSQGHINLGGFDIFKSKIIGDKYETAVNLGNTINSKSDQVALFLSEDNKGYVSSNKVAGERGFDISKFEYKRVQNISKEAK